MKPEYERTGAAAMLYVENYDERGRRQAVLGGGGWILEDNQINKAMRRARRDASSSATACTSGR